MKALLFAVTLGLCQFGSQALAATTCENQVASDARAKLESDYIIKDMKTISIRSEGDHNVAVVECTSATKGGTTTVTDQYMVDITSDCHVKDDMKDLARMFDEQ